MLIDIEIDSITNCLVERKTGEKLNTEYRLVRETITKKDAEALKKQGWKFDWSIPQTEECEIYELLIAGEKKVQGMIALRHIRNQYYTHVSLVESAPWNIGKEGQYEGVGAHLFALACKLSWDVGNEGYVQFYPKTPLIEHYKKTLGAKMINSTTMYIDTYAAEKLINTYFKGV